MICYNCKHQIQDGLGVCPVCRANLMYQYQQYQPRPQFNNQMNYQQNPNVSKGHSGLVLAIVLPIFFIGLFTMVFIFARSFNNSEKRNTATVSDAKTTETITESFTEESTDAIETPSIITASDFSNMKLHDICNNDDLYIGLSYAKISNAFTTILGSTEEIASDKQVLFAFFDFYNSGSERKSIDDGFISCYVDGVSYTKVETYFYYIEDGITNKLSNDLYGGTNKLMITNFEIPKQWNEIKLYYKSDCIWVLTPGDVSTDPFEFQSMYDIDYKKEGTPENIDIYSDEYKIQYNGYEYYKEERKNEEYIIVKFTITNTKDTALDYSNVGYDMNCYADNYVIDNADYTVDAKLGDYLNAYKISEIQSGMSSKIYFAFEISEHHDYYHMVYDTGYMYNNPLADIYINEN